MTSLRIPIIDRVNSVACHRVLVGFVAALGALAAHAAPLTMTLKLQPQKGHFAEQCFVLERGQQLAYQFSTSHPIDFNLHHHPATGPTVLPDRLTVKSQHSKRIVAESAGAYCFMATNSNDQPGAFDIVISYEVTAQ